MFTGIIETMGTLTQVRQEQSNKHFTIQSTISSGLKIDQSIAHNGVCLTVIAVDGNMHTVTAIEETLLKTNLSHLREGALVNLEQCMQLNGRLDGHIVQGHVDQTAQCTAIQNKQGSWFFTFTYDASLGNVTVEKGSVCINGISLTVVNASKNTFSVAIIPYTYEHTTMHTLQVGDWVNIEFDIIGKYVARLLKNG